MKRPVHRPAFTLIELLVVIAIIGILVSLLLPAVQSAREAARRLQCNNNLKQIGIALHNYEGTYRTFPPASSAPSRTTVPPPPYRHGWVAMTLPWIEQTNVQGMYSVAVHWYDPPNSQVIQIPLAVYHCPSADFGRSATSKAAVFGVRTAAAWDYASVNVSSYVPGYAGTANVNRRKGVMNDREGSRIAHITDGTSNSLMVSEDANRPQLWVKGRQRTDLIAQTSNFPAGIVGPGEVTGGVWADHQKAVSVGGPAWTGRRPSAVGRARSIAPTTGKSTACTLGARVGCSAMARCDSSAQASGSKSLLPFAAVLATKSPSSSDGKFLSIQTVSPSPRLARVARPATRR